VVCVGILLGMRHVCPIPHSV